jgi:murein L,D-transpeptidase YcbB/YkuD
MAFKGLLSTRQTVQVFLAIIGISFGCRSSVSQSGATGAQDLYFLPETHSIQEVILMPSDSSDEVYKGLGNRASVIRFYERREYNVAWYNPERVLPVSDSMVSLIRKARYYGLLPQDYHLQELASGKQSPRRTDALLTDAFLLFFRNLKYGRISSLKDSTGDSLGISLLQNVLQGANLRENLEHQEPQFSDYHLLREALRLSLDSLESESRKVLMLGITDSSNPLHRKIQSVEINLERWRWENAPFGKRYIFINIPAFMLTVVSNDTAVITSRVITGAPETPTPVLSSTIECFTLYPYWHVPRKIAVEEYLPVIKKDSSFIDRNNFDVLDRRGNLLNRDSVPWEKFSKNYFPVTLRQREGTENSLGVIKFVFDNPYAVFLHDTNAKRLFKSSVRAFSHGCIRMEKAVELGHYLATGSIGKKSKLVESYLNQKQRRTINLKEPIRLYVRYFTCAYQDNQFCQYPDIYSLDQRLISEYYTDSRDKNL